MSDESGGDHPGRGRVGRQARALAKSLGALHTKIDNVARKLNILIKKAGRYSFLVILSSTLAFVAAIGTLISWNDAILKAIGWREAVSFHFEANGTSLVSDQYDYKTRIVHYKLTVAISNSGSPIGGQGRLLIVRTDADGTPRLVAVSGPNRSADNMSITVRFTPTSAFVRLRDLPAELLFCAQQTDGKQRRIPVLTRLATEFANTSEVRGATPSGPDIWPEGKVGYVPYITIPNDAEATDPLTRSDVCSNAAKQADPAAVQRCIPLSPAFNVNCHPDEKQDDAEVTAPDPFLNPVDPAIAARAEAKKLLTESALWVDCSNGTCFLRDLGQQLPVVKTIEFGISPSSLDRSILVPSIPIDDIRARISFDAGKEIPRIFVVPNASTFFRLTYVDGSQSDIREYKDRSNFSTIKGALLKGEPDNPILLLAAFNTNGATWYFLPLLAPDEMVSGYAGDEGAFYDVKKGNNGQIWNNDGIQVRDDLPNGYIRLRIAGKAFGEDRELKFEVPKGLPGAARTANVVRDARKLIECQRFSAEKLKFEHDSSFSGLMSQNSISMAMNASGYGFVHQPGIACILPQMSGASVRDAADVLDHVEFRVPPDTRIAAPIFHGDDNINNQPVEYMRNYAHALLPDGATEIDVTLVFKSGDKSPEFRLPLPPRG